MDIPAAANVLGTVGAVCWSVQLIPQIFINYRRHHAIGLQPSMMMLWAWAGVPLGVYNILEGFNIALRIQPQILTVLSLITWIQCYHYQELWKPLKSLAAFITMACLMGGTEAALIFALRVAKKRGVEWPLTMMAVLSATLLAAGVLRHYWDIAVHRTVRGISFIFVGIDAAGDLFSLLSICFQPELDVKGLAIYGTELTLWVGVFACGGYFNLLPWARSKMGLIQSRKAAEVQHPSAVTATASGNTHHRADGITLHDLPSSTSVFRTPSCEIATIRARSSNMPTSSS
ncbi:PQ loop repeat-domain-containing protein [Xylariales sp. PMI_506]|nr:PQ loop repeat-domain-containing protein [Xylariales sp. PMI_506]